MTRAALVREKPVLLSADFSLSDCCFLDSLLLDIFIVYGAEHACNQRVVVATEEVSVQSFYPLDLVANWGISTAVQAIDASWPKRKFISHILGKRNQKVG